MKVYHIKSCISHTGTGNKILNTVERNGVKHFATIEDFYIKNKHLNFLSEEKELEIMNYMHKLQEQLAIESFNAVQASKRLILNA